jgi:hypothetical protein
VSRAPDQFLNSNFGAMDAKGGDFSPGGHRGARSYRKPQRPPASWVLSTTATVCEAIVTASSGFNSSAPTDLTGGSLAAVATRPKKVSCLAHPRAHSVVRGK